jgi:hypothetical protein
MFLSHIPNGPLYAAVGSTLLAASASGVVARATFAAAVTGLAASGDALVVLADDKTLSSVSLSGIGELSVTESQTLARRGSALGVFPAPAGAGVAGARVAVVGDKTGDVTALGPLPTVRARRRTLLGHTGSIVTAITLAGARDELLLTGDRDGKIRASAWSTPWRVASFLLAHTRAVTGIAPLTEGIAHYARSELVASAGGDGALRLWHARSGTLLHTTYFTFSGPFAAAGGADAGGALVVESTPPGVAHVDADTTFSKTDDGGGGGGGGGDGGDGDPAADGARALDDDGASSADGDAAAEVAADAPPSAVPALDVSRGAATLPPLVVPAALVAFSGGAACGGAPLVASVVVGDAGVRVFAAVAEPTATVAVPHAAYEAAALASGAGACGGGGGGVVLAQVRLRAVGTLRGAAGAAVPLALAPWSDGARVGILFGGLFPAPPGDSRAWVRRVVALSVESAAGAAAGGADDVGGGWRWEADAAAGAPGGAPLCRLVPVPDAAAPPAVAALCAALEADTPAGLDAAASARDASAVSAAPNELDKGSWARPKRAKDA